MSGPGRRAQLVWTALLLAGALAAALAADQHGRASRAAFAPPADFQGRRWAVTRDAASAVELWAQVGVHGRRVLVATGRWSKPVAQDQGPAPEAGSAADRAVRVAGALFDATQRGLARELTVVMPTAAFEARVAAMRAIPEATFGDGWALQPYHGIPRGFFRPATLPRPGEPVVLLIEPSFFSGDAPPDLLAWLDERGVRFDLGVIVAQDPAASEAQQTAAMDLATRVGAVPVEVDP